MDEYFNILENVKKEISSSQYQVVAAANKSMIRLYWNIGNVISEFSKWGNKFIENLSKDLKLSYPNAKGYSIRNLKYMKKFAERFKDFEIVQEVLAQINWYSNLTLLDKVKTKEEHIWYAKECIENGWSRNVLVHQIESKLLERQSIIQKDTNFKRVLVSPFSELAEETIKDPYVFDFIPYKGKLLSFSS